ncbi:ferritin family protein [Chloroflexota bacterium]
MPTEMDKTTGAVQMAIQMEIDGKEFYLKASQASNNKLGKDLLQSLAAEEDIHRQKFEEIYDTISRKKAWPDIDFQHDGGRKLRTIFARAIENNESGITTIPTELDALQTAMAMENKTLDYYQSRSKLANYDAERNFYEALSIQEGEHHRILLDYYEFLKDPASWFVQKEHPSLDGS